MYGPFVLLNPCREQYSPAPTTSSTFYVWICFEPETHVLVQFPADIDFESCELMLNRPNNKDQDLLYKIKDTKTFTIDKSSLSEGVYNYRLTYTVEGKNCIQKEQIYI